MKTLILSVSLGPPLGLAMGPAGGSRNANRQSRHRGTSRVPSRQRWRRTSLSMTLTAARRAELWPGSLSQVTRTTTGGLPTILTWEACPSTWRRPWDRSWLAT